MQKLKEAEQLISEANDHLQNTTDLLAAQVLLQSETTMLTEACKEQENYNCLNSLAKKQTVK